MSLGSDVFEDCDDSDCGPSPEDLTAAAMKRLDKRFGMKWGPAKPGDYTPPRWLLRRYLMQDTVSALYGAPGTAKSFLALHMALCIATGHEFDGIVPTQAATVYIAAEGQNAAKMRVEAWQEHHHRTPGANDFVLVTEPVKLLDDKMVDEFVEILRFETAKRGIRIGLIVFDTLSQCTSGADEQAAKEMSKAVSAMIRVKKALNTTVLFVHHTGKDVTKGMRGSSTILANTDCAMHVEKDEGSTIGSMTVKRQKDGESGAVLGFETLLVDIPWLLEAGEEVSSTLIVDFPQAPAAAKAQQQAADNMAQLRAIVQTVEQAGEPLTVTSALRRAGGWRGDHYERKLCQLLPLDEEVEVLSSLGKG